MSPELHTPYLKAVSHEETAQARLKGACYGVGMEGKPIKTEEEISNVDLQFMGNTDEKRDLNTTVRMESQAAKVADAPEQKGLDKQDVAVTLSMDASDPPSTNMGDEDR